jgi:hypothetical protein
MVTLGVDGAGSVVSVVRDEGALREVLEQSDPQVPTAFQLRPQPRMRGQRSLMVGLHGKQGVLWWSDPSCSESLIAIGGDNTEEVLYYIGTADFEFPPHSELPRVEVLAAADEFLRTGQRPVAVVTWVDSDEAFMPHDSAPHGT